ncbi:MAG TPA: MltR family transcriptional regulator [Verrucomicrobiae bacterium]
MTDEVLPPGGGEAHAAITEVLANVAMDEGTLSYFRSLFRESDRGAVLISATRLEEKLELLHRAHIEQKVAEPKKLLEELFRPYAPLSSFSAKIQLAHAYGLIDAEDYADLNIIRKIRNDAAHTSVEFSFEPNDICQRITHLKAPSRMIPLLSLMTEMFSTEELSELKGPKVAQAHPKMYYIIACLALETRIVSTTGRVTVADD